MNTKSCGAWLVSTILAGVAAAGDTSTRAHAFAQLPYWSGVWQSTDWLVDESGRPPGGIAQVLAESQLGKRPPYNKEWGDRYDAHLNNAAELAAHRMAHKACDYGFPALMESPRMFQIWILPEETLFLFENGETRQIYTDRRNHPSKRDLWPTSVGDSVGRWNRDVLQVDTIGRSPSRTINTGVWMSVLSEQAHFVEEFRLVDANTLEDRLTIDDPIALERPWSIRLLFKRLPKMDRMLPYDCNENDRNPLIEGKIGIVAP